MKLHKIDNRELRSLRLRNKVLNLRNFFESEKSFGLFMMNDSLQPNSWISKREEYSKNNLKIETLPKKVVTYLTNDSNWEKVKFLLKGNVVLIRPKDAKISTLTPQQIKFLISEEKYFLRFTYWNQSFYRFNDLEKILTFNQIDNNHIMNLMFLLKKTVLMRTLFLPTLLIKKT